MTSTDRRTPDAPDFEARARALLTQYAQQAPTSANTEARVRERLAVASGAAPTPTRYSLRWAPRRVGGWALGAVSVALVAALLVGFFGVSHLRNDHNGGIGNPTRSNSVILSGKLQNCMQVNIPANGGSAPDIPRPCPSQTISVDFEVTQSYADTIHTSLQERYSALDAAVSLSSSPDQGPIAPTDINISPTTLLDAQGRHYFSEGASYDTTEQSGVMVTTATVAFTPLPEDALKTPQTLTLPIASAELSYQYADPSQPAQEIQVTGVLNVSKVVTIHVTPHPGRAVMLQVAPQTHHGVTLQPLEFDIGASSSDSFGAGERLIVRYSGLPATTPLAALTDLSSGYALPDGSNFNGTADATLLFERQKPAIASVVAPDDDLLQNPVVGPSGTAEVEFLFFGPPLPSTSGVQTLTLDRIVTGYQVGSNGGIIGPSGFSEGPWTFNIPLS